MYTKRESQSVSDHWRILDGDGDVICTVIGEFAADALLSHLNRNY